MIKVSQNEAMRWIEFISLVRQHFGDENIFFTFTPFKNHKIHEKYLSTFSSDNIHHLASWSILMDTKLLSGSIDLMTIVLRVFLKENISGTWPNGKTFTIPKKDIYHIMVNNSDLIFYDDYETFNAQNINANDNTQLEEEPGVTCKSSLDLFNVLIDKKLNL